MKINLNELLERPMNRQEFLQFAGFVMLSIFGINNLISFLMNHQQSPHIATKPTDRVSHGFGGSKFGQ